MTTRTARTYTISRRAAPHLRPEAGRAAARPAPDMGKPLSNRQKAALASLARRAFEHQDNLGLVEAEGKSTSARFGNWRHAQTMEAVGISSLRECGNNHYRKIRAHFLLLLGEWDESFATTMRTGKVWQKGPDSDTHEKREEYRALMLESLIRHGRRCDPRSADYNADVAARVAAKGGMIHHGYVIALAKDKCKGKPLDTLTAHQLFQILCTLNNRISAREGRGSAGSRNKKQRM